MQQREKGFVNLSSRIEPTPEFEKAEEAEESEEAEIPENAEELAKAFSKEEQQDQELASGRYWEHYTNRPDFAAATNSFSIPYQEITSMAADSSTDYLWLIFAGQHLARMRMVRRIEKVDGKNVTVERADWQMLHKFVPWADGERLNVVWFNNGKIYIGSSQGFYILENPESEDMNGDPFKWQHYGVFQGLSIPEVRGFAWWQAQNGKVLAIMHNQSISIWDGNHFTKIELAGDNTCIKSGSDGNLWIGTTKGLNRIDPTGEMYSYTTVNAHFMSDVITAIGIMPTENSSVSVWVACDGFVKYSEKGQSLDGSDKMPHLVKRRDGTTVTYDDYSVSDIRFQSTSLHYYDGLTWEKWRVAGIRDLFIDRNYIWAATNVRVRRMRIDHSDY